MNSVIDQHTLALRRRKKRRLIRYVILVCLCLFIFFTYLESRVFQLGKVPFPVSGNVLVFALININVVLLLLMAFLVMRNLVELVFERRRRVIGTKLRTRLVVSFVSLSLVPTTLLFFVALQFVSTSMDYWFNINVDRSLSASLDLAQEVYQDTARQVKRRAAETAVELAVLGVKTPRSRQLLKRRLGQYGLSGLTVLTVNGKPKWQVWDKKAGSPPIISEGSRHRGLKSGVFTVTQTVADGELVNGLVAFKTAAGGSYTLAASLLIPRQRLERMEIISKGIEGYRQLLLLKKPLKSSLLLMLLIVTLLIIFSAIWFGFYVAGGLTRPIDKLAAAIQRVAGGELDFVLEKDTEDEMGRLFDAFNRMTKDLLSSKRQVEEVNKALKEINIETEQRRRYTEIILQNVTAGVISLDSDGRINMINHFAEELLKINHREVLNKHYKTILRLSHLSILENFFVELSQSGKSTIQRPLRITVNNEALSLLVNFTRLEDDEGRPLGVVIVFDNLTELEKIQRMAAWREVARRIAHEVKNPLTPIQLSAQRLRKRYMEGLGDDAEVFDQCTRTIIKQVDELKHLVSEFSNFARMPAVKKALNDVVALARDVLVLYEVAHLEISFKLIAAEVKRFAFDPEQMRRVLVNLLDNAVAALEGMEGGRIEVLIRQDEGGRLVFIEVSDNGPSINDADKLKLFEPYFSTKKTGTGLGLAIASTVIADHDGYLRVKDNQPRGARFIIELPMVGSGWHSTDGG